jgi:hypothetical protein
MQKIINQVRELYIFLGISQGAMDTFMHHYISP